MGLFMEGCDSKRVGHVKTLVRGGDVGVRGEV